MCQYIANVYVLVFSNDLSVTNMGNNLIMMFIILEAGLVAKNTAKIHAMDPSVEDHSIHFLKFNICITLFLHGIFSYFSMSNPSLATLKVTH